MMYLKILFGIILPHLTNGSNIQLENESKLLIYLHTLFKVELDIFVADVRNNWSPTITKIRSQNYMITTIMNVKQLHKHLSDMAHDGKTMIIIKNEESLKNIVSLMETPWWCIWVLLINSSSSIGMNYSSIPKDTNVILVKSDRSKLEIFKIVKKVEKEIILENWGNVTENGNIMLRNHDLLGYQTNLNGTVLDLARISHDQCKDENMKKIVDKVVECFHEELLILMSFRLNFTPNFVECPDKDHPYVLPNGSYSGLFKMLHDKEVDASGGSFVVIQNRLYSLDFAWPTFTIKSIMFIKDDLNDDQWNSYLKPFDKYVWLIIFFWILFFAFLTFLFNYLFNNYTNEISLKSEVSLANAMLTSFQIFCNQGIRDDVRSDSCRMIYICTLFLVSFLSPSYSGSIVSSLTIHIPKLPFSTLEELLGNGLYKITAIKNSFIAYYFTYDYLPLHYPNKIHLMSDFKDLPETDREGIDQLCGDKKLTYVGYEENIAKITHHECGIFQIPKHVGRQYQGIGMPKFSPYKELFSKELCYFRSNGITHRMKSLMRRSKLKKIANPELFSVSLSQTFSSFVILMVGIIISAIFLITEIYWYRKMKRRYNYRKKSNETEYIFYGDKYERGKSPLKLKKFF